MSAIEKATAPKNNLSFEQIDALLRYDPTTGWFYWKVSRGSARTGERAGCLNGAGYIVIGVNGRLCLAHRLAILLMTGKWPCEDVDHINRNRADNAWRNLRSCSRSENLQNAGINSRNTSGYKGVSFDKHRKKWRASIRVGGRDVHLGRFETSEEAAAAYADAANDRNSTFART